MKNSILAGLILLTTAFVSSGAEGAYYRFWRGERLPILNAEDFRRGLNEGLFPATGKLAQTAARLTSYQPVLLPEQAERMGLPAEVALVGYESQAAYQAYRSTSEGKAYGDLHWLYFSRESSGSLEPQSFLGGVEMNRAYDLIGGAPDWQSGYASFRVYARDPGRSDAEYLASVAGHLGFLSGQRPRALVLLVAEGYVMEYSLWESAEEQASVDAGTARDDRFGRSSVILDPLAEIAARLLFDIPLAAASELDFGQGIRYPLR